LLSCRPDYECDGQSTGVQVAALLVELLTGASGEVQRVGRLRQMYAVQHPPSVELLQQPQVLAKLVHSIFGAKPPPADALEATAAVAALAAAAIDDRCDWGAAICSGSNFAHTRCQHTPPVVLIVGVLHSLGLHVDIRQSSPRQSAAGQAAGRWT
jgi:TH1 protein